MGRSKLRKGAAVLLVAAVAVALAGCSVINVPQHVTDTAADSGDLATHLSYSHDVVSASAVYNPADSSGESVRVKVRMKDGATAADWNAVLGIARKALTREPLSGTRRFLDVAQAGNSGPRFEPQQFVTWPTAASVEDEFAHWHAVERATGMDLKFQLASGTTPVPYVSTSRAQSERFMNAESAPSVPSGVALQGYGFAADSVPSPDVTRAYKVLLSGDTPIAPPTDPMQSFVPGPKPGFTLTWDPRLGMVANFYTPRSEGRKPTRAVIDLVGQLLASVPSSELAVTWSDGDDAAWVTFGACPKPTKLTVAPADKVFAASITAGGYSIPSSGGAGQCLP